VANLYGVANAPGLPIFYNCIGAADVVCNAGAETNFIDTGLIVAPSLGYFYAMAWLAVVVSTGVGAPSSINFALRVNNGADQSNVGLNSAFLTPSTNSIFYYPLLGTPSQTVWQGGGAHVQLSASCTTNAITVRYPGTWCLIGLFRAPDQ
jgi:hypothetical protein